MDEQQERQDEQAEVPEPVVITCSGGVTASPAGAGA
jgi:hypothetical protein